MFPYVADPWHLYRVFAKLKGETVEEWDTALSQLAEIQQRGATLDLKPEDPPIIIVEEVATPAAEPEPQPEAETTAPEATTATVNETEPAAMEPQTDAPPTNGEANTTTNKAPTPASSSARTSKTDLKGGSDSKSSDKDKASVRGNAPCGNKGWQSVIGISMWRRNWSRSKQQRVI